LIFSGNDLASNQLNVVVKDEGNISQYQPYLYLSLGQSKDFGKANFDFEEQYLSGSFDLGLIKATALMNDWLISENVAN